MSWQDRDYHREQTDTDAPLLRRLSGRSFTFWIIVVNIAVFVLDALLARVIGRAEAVGNGPLTDWAAFSADAAIHRYQLWRFVSYSFLHAGLLHILFNLWALYYFGRIVEPYLGSRRFLAFYLLSAVGGAGLFVGLWGLGILFGDPRVPFVLVQSARTELVGASAGVFGVLVAAAVINPQARVSLLLPPVTLSLRTLAWIVLGIAAFVLMTSGDNAGGQAAHLGGAAVGYLFIRLPGLLNFADPRNARRGRLLPWQPQATTDAGLASWQERRQKELEAQRAADAEVDRILDKVRSTGLQSLSAKEKKTLQQATERQRSRG